MLVLARNFTYKPQEQDDMKNWDKVAELFADIPILPDYVDALKKQPFTGQDAKRVYEELAARGDPIYVHWSGLKEDDEEVIQAKAKYRIPETSRLDVVMRAPDGVDRMY